MPQNVRLRKRKTGRLAIGGQSGRSIGGSLSNGLVPNPGGGFRIGEQNSGRNQPPNPPNGQNKADEEKRRKLLFQQQILLKLLENGQFKGDPLEFARQAAGIGADQDQLKSSDQLPPGRQRRFARQREGRARNRQFRIQQVEKARLEREAKLAGRTKAKRVGVERLTLRQKRKLSDAGVGTITSRGTTGSPTITIASSPEVRTSAENQALAQQVARRAAEASASALLRNSTPQIVDTATGQPVSPERRNELIKMSSTDLEAAGFKLVAGVDPRSQKVSDEIAQGGARRSAEIANRTPFQGQGREPDISQTGAERRANLGLTPEAIQRSAASGQRLQDRGVQNIPPLADALATRARQQSQIEQNRQSVRDSILREKARLLNARSEQRTPTLPASAPNQPASAPNQQPQAETKFTLTPRPTNEETRLKANQEAMRAQEAAVINEKVGNATKNRFESAIKEAAPGTFSDTIFVANPGSLGADSVQLKKAISAVKAARNNKGASAELIRAQLIELRSTPGLDAVLERAQRIPSIATSASLVNPTGVAIASQKAAEYVTLVQELEKLLDPSTVQDRQK